MMPIINAIRYEAERLFLLAVEVSLRPFLRLDPRLYSQARRVRRVIEGAAEKPGRKFFIVVLYCRGHLPAFTRSLIEAVARSAFNLVVVSNGPLTPQLEAELRPNCRLLIERENIGRDIGGYKDAISVVTDRFAGIKRLAIANDSVFYLPDGLGDLIAALDGDADFIGVSETYDRIYHVASFMLSFSRRVIESRAFRDFWRWYIPIGTRQWTIFEGEGALTAALLRGGFRPRVLCRIADLPARLNGHDVTALLPSGLRGESSAHIADEAMKRNQMHAAGLLFFKFMGLPLIKRDIVYRDLYSYDDASRLLSDVAEPLRGEILDDLRRRGNSKQFGFIGRLVHRHG